MKLKIEKTHRKPMRQKALLGRGSEGGSRIDKTSWKSDEGKNSIHKGKTTRNYAAF